MSGWTAQQLAAAIGILVAAFAANAVVLARTYAQVVNILEGLHRSGVNIRGAKSGGSGGVSYRVVSTTKTTPVSPVLPLESVNQLTGVTVSPTPASTGPVDCGPACVVSCIEEMKGCWSADELLRLRYFGTVDDRLTTASDLVGMLQSNGIAAHARSQIDSSSAKQEIIRNWQAGRPSIVLGEWVQPGYGHWVKFVGDRNGPVVMNPYPGSNAPSTWDEFGQNFWGEYVHVDGLITSGTGLRPI
jgi:hypothetical protein